MLKKVINGILHHKGTNRWCITTQRSSFASEHLSRDVQQKRKTQISLHVLYSFIINFSRTGILIPLKCIVYVATKRWTLSKWAPFCNRLRSHWISSTIRRNKSFQSDFRHALRLLNCLRSLAAAISHNSLGYDIFNGRNRIARKKGEQGAKVVQTTGRNLLYRTYM